MLKFIAQLVGRVKRIRPSDVRVPMRPGDVGYDLCASEDTLLPGRTITWVKTGVAIEARAPLWYMIVARSSFHKRNLFVCPGIIDGGYQGELLVAVVNMHEGSAGVKKGEYIAQCIFGHVVQPELVPVEEFLPSDRGANGFGSTDR